ncbi:hypothetical protein [Halalkalibacter sp. APA_J-10(15)]|uniref:hypothetical protein n=1 Tax=Halalkalibacter sp. APA_J-10(15) TaxID=2933805 RepID=UPI001FF3F690|nr:hypothetical protein [Halalkalibacter sp. APA_J-10(15)]MCK0470876.1 hypothetical protein [Halalkalibacter sp. APA_J-10(15)]
MLKQIRSPHGVSESISKVNKEAKELVGGVIDMIREKDVLFDGRNQVSNEEVIERMKEYISDSNELKELYEEDKRATVELARILRNNLRTEYKNNSLQRIGKLYNDHDLFSGYYKPAVIDAYVKTTGQLTQRNVYSFLYDVVSYMRYYLPKEYKN